MKISSFIGLLASVTIGYLLYKEYSLYSWLFFIHVISNVIYYTSIVFMYILGDEDNIETCCKDAWGNNNSFENFIYFSIPIIPLFKAIILDNKKKAKKYAILVNYLIIFGLSISLYITYEIIFLYLLIVQIFLTFTLAKSDIEKRININNVLVVFIVYSLPITYIFVWLWNSCSTFYMYNKA